MIVETGEQIDLGEITFERNPQRPWKSKAHRGPMKRTKPPVAAKVTASAPSSRRLPGNRDTPKGATPKPDTPTHDISKRETTTREIRGRVLLPNGQPAVGATVALIESRARPRALDEWKTFAFHYEFPAGGPFDLNGRLSLPRSQLSLPIELVEKLTVVSGEQIDLGTTTIEPIGKGLQRPKVHRGPVKRTKPGEAHANVR
jgi:hypothetical protein